MDASDASDARERWSGTWTARLLFAAVCAVTAYPPGVALYREGLEGAFRYFAGDTFYYLSVASRSVGQPFFTFDGTHPTNGFHPLWQIYLERSFSALGLDAAGQIEWVAITSIVLVALGTAFFSLALLRVGRRPWLALLGAVPGVFYFAMPGVIAHHFSQWSFANGMESPLSIFFFGLLAWGLLGRGWLAEDRGARSLVGVSLMLSLITLSRLDDVFVFLPLLGFAALTGRTLRERIVRVVTASLPPLLLIGTYLLYNALHAESLLPSSGSAKVQPLWGLARNLYALWTTLAPFADPLGRGNAVWVGEAWRLVQMLAPALAAGAWLLTQRMSLRPEAGSRASWENGVIGAMAVYVIAKSTYNFAMVGLWNQGQWYYPISIMVFNLIAVVFCARVLDERRVRPPAVAGDGATTGEALLDRLPALRRLPLATVLVACLVLVTAHGFVETKRRGGHQSRSFDFWVERSATSFMLERSCPGCGVVAFDDGIVSYSLQQVPTLNGLGLVTDREAREALAHGHLLDLAWERGHRFFVTVNYPMASEAYRDPATLRAHLRQNRHLAEEDLDRWHFEVDFVGPTTGVPFVRFEPLASDGLQRAARDRREPSRRPLPPNHAKRDRIPITAPRGDVG